MISSEWSDGVTKIANKLIKESYPILGDNYFKSADVLYVLKANQLLLDEWLVKINENT
jgi:hypothetical protein